MLGRILLAEKNKDSEEFKILSDKKLLGLYEVRNIQ
jgi:hypothetical protein